jgi:DeoR family transcriptional regulator of aga operon
MVALARAIPAQLPLTLITSVLNVGLELPRRQEIKGLQLDGYLRHSSSMTGPPAEQALTKIAYSKLFLGVDGIDLDSGLTTTNTAEARLNHQI